MCSRDLKASEAEKGLIPTIIGKDGVAVIVNGAGVKDLTIEQVAKIYDGTYTNWSQVGGVDKSIGVVCREDGSGTRECFEVNKSIHTRLEDEIGCQLTLFHRCRDQDDRQHRRFNRIHQYRTIGKSLMGKMDVR